MPLLGVSNKGMYYMGIPLLTTSKCSGHQACQPFFMSDTISAHRDDEALPTGTAVLFRPTCPPLQAPKGPCSYMVYTQGSKGFAYTYFKGKVYTI